MYRKYQIKNQRTKREADYIHFLSKDGFVSDS